jgi:hypothetical protein
LLHQGKHAISGFIALFQKIGAKSLNLPHLDQKLGQKV